MYKKISLITIFLFLACLCSCGRMGVPVPPPSHAIESVQSLEVFQQGESIFVCWPQPHTLKIGTSEIVRADIYRLPEPPDSSRTIREEIYLEQAQIIGFLDNKMLSTNKTSLLSFEDKLDVQNAALNKTRFRYAIRYVTAQDHSGPLSNYAFVTPSTQIANKPNNLKALVTQESIKVTWQAPTKKLDDSLITEPPMYNIYRYSGKAGKLTTTPINPVPLTEPEFIDTKFQFGSTYNYVVRSITTVQRILIESTNSDPIKVLPIDTFSPSTPGHVTGASAAGVVSLFWPSNLESDIKGYFVYRSENVKTPTWVRISPTQPITTTTYQDTTGDRRKTYLYSITAVDVFNNESLYSEAITVEVVD